MLNKFNFKIISQVSFLAASCFIGSVFAFGTAAYNQENSLGSVHTGKATTPISLWSVTQQKQADYETKMKAEIKANPDSKAAYANLAVLYLANNKTLKAIDAYQEAINHDSENAKLFAGLSVAYLHQSKYSMAKAMAEQAMKIDPSMKHAIKIKEYIDAKEEVIAKASKIEAKPDDITHQSMPSDSIHKKN